MTRADGHSSIGVTDEGTVAVLGNDVLDLEVPARTDAVATVRHAVVDHLTTRGVPSTVVDDIELVTSELVTNAIIHPRPLHGGPSVHLRLSLSDAIKLMVTNVGPATAIPPVDEWQPAPPFALSGRGLAIVRRLCDNVTVEQAGERAVVTCRRRLPDGGVKP